MPPAAAAAGSKWSSIKPAAIRTWVRIRPLAAEEEKGGHGDGERVEKELGAFDESAVNIISHDQRGKQTAYDYPSRVFPVECTQESVGAEVLPGLLEDFWGERNTMIFAYGQTGTGKTTTMFSFPESLTSETDNPGWGLLPRAVHATLERNAQEASKGVHSVLLLSAVEFYAFMGQRGHGSACARERAHRRCECGASSLACPWRVCCLRGAAFDLADVAGKQMCTMKGHQVLGNTYTQCDSPAILKAFIERVYGNRKVVATRMNEGSVRMAGHAAVATRRPSRSLASLPTMPRVESRAGTVALSLCHHAHPTHARQPHPTLPADAVQHRRPHRCGAAGEGARRADQQREGDAGKPRAGMAPLIMDAGSGLAWSRM